MTNEPFSTNALIAPPLTPEEQEELEDRKALTAWAIARDIEGDTDDEATRQRCAAIRERHETGFLRGMKRVEEAIRRLGSTPDAAFLRNLPLFTLLDVLDLDRYSQKLRGAGFLVQLHPIPKGKKRGPKRKASEEDRRRIVAAATQEDTPRHIVAETHGITLKTLRRWENELRATLKNDDFPK